MVKQIFYQYWFKVNRMFVVVDFFQVFFLLQEDLNVIIVDWGYGVGILYVQVIVNIWVVGVLIVQLIKELMLVGFLFVDFYIIGYSLGVYIVGYVGERLYILGQIIGIKWNYGNLLICSQLFVMFFLFFYVLLIDRLKIEILKKM